MKTFLAISIFLISQIISYGAYSQDISDTLGVSFNKTIQLVFTSEVKDTDVGSPDVMLQLSDDSKKLKLKAADMNFPETNLLIETEKGFYSFVLIYNENPTKFIYKIESEIAVLDNEDLKSSSKQEEGSQVNTAKNKDEIYINSKKVLDQDRDVMTIGEINKKMSFYLNGVFVDYDHLYFSVSIENNSNVDYDIDFFRFYVKDNKNTGKRTSIQETDKYPIYEMNKDEKEVVISKKVNKVFVFDKFTIDKNESLYIELWELNGERNLKLRINANNILESKII